MPYNEGVVEIVGIAAIVLVYGAVLRRMRAQRRASQPSRPFYPDLGFLLIMFFASVMAIYSYWSGKSAIAIGVWAWFLIAGCYYVFRAIREQNH